MTAVGYQPPANEAEKVHRRLDRYPEAIRLVDEGKARPQVVEVVEILRKGLNGLEIAELLGLGKSTIYQRLSDPTDEKNHNRKLNNHGGTCENCGGRTSYGKAGEGPCRFCHECQGKGYAFWTKEKLIEAIQRWARLYGKPPSASEWNSALRPHPDYSSGDWPAWNTVAYYFGSWSAGIEAAGFEPHRMGGHPRVPCTQEELAETASLVDSLGLKEAAERLGLTTWGVERRLAKHKGRNQMGAPLTAQAVIDREIEKADVRIERLREDIEALSEQREQLAQAKAVLNGGAKAGE